jgi:hypothetical protein
VSTSRLTGALDYLALLACAASAAIYGTGGFVTTIAGLTISARQFDRPLVAAAAAIALRLLIDRRAPLPQLPLALWKYLYSSTADVANAPISAARARYPLALLGFAAFAGVLLWPQLVRLDAIPEYGDPLFSVWRVSWVYRQLLGDPRDLFDANIFYPHRLTLTYSDSMLFPSLTVAPLLAAGIHPVIATNLVLVASFVLSAFTMYLLVERLTGSPLAAFISGLIFGFYPFRFDHYAHFELLMTYCLPAILLAMHRFFELGRMRAAVIAALLAVAQLYSSMYLAVLFMWVALPVVLVLVAQHRPPLRRLLVASVAAGALALALAYPLAATYRSAQLTERTSHELSLYSAEPRDYGRAHPRSALWGDENDPPPAERALFPGAMAIVLAVIAFTRRLGPHRLVYLVALAAAFELSLGANGLVYPYLFDSLSFMRGMRAPARAGFLFGLALAVLAGFGAQRLLAGRSRAAAFGIVAVLTVAIGIDLRPRIELQTVWPTPPSIYQSVTRSSVLAEFPMGLSPGTTFMTDTPHMYFSIWHGAQLINGYSGHGPSDHLEFLTNVQSFPDEASIEAIRQRGATHVTVNCFMYDRCGRLLSRIRRSPDLRLVAETVWQDRPVLLYELVRSPNGSSNRRRP